MNRTAEQVAADDALTVAVEQVNHAYYGDSPRVLTDYVVLFVEQSFDEEGEPVTAIGVNPRDGDLPAYRQLGLYEYATSRLRARLWAPPEDV